MLKDVRLHTGATQCREWFTCDKRSSDKTSLIRWGSGVKVAATYKFASANEADVALHGNVFSEFVIKGFGIQKHHHVNRCIRFMQVLKQ